MNIDPHARNHVEEMMSNSNKTAFNTELAIKLLAIGLTISAAACARNFGPNNPQVRNKTATTADKTTSATAERTNLTLKEDIAFTTADMITIGSDFKGTRVEFNQDSTNKEILIARVTLSKEDSVGLMTALTLDVSTTKDENGNTVATGHQVLTEKVGAADVRITENFECSSQRLVDEDGTIQQYPTTSCSFILDPKTGKILTSPDMTQEIRDRLALEKNRYPGFEKSYVGDNLLLVGPHSKFLGQIKLAGVDARALFETLAVDTQEEKLGIDNEVTTVKRSGANISCMMTAFKNNTVKYYCGLNLNYQTGVVNSLAK